MRRLNLTSTRNTRELGGYPAGRGYTNWKAFLRSDAPVDLTREDVERLKDYGVSRILDLRAPEERERRPGFFPQKEIAVESVPFPPGPPPGDPAMTAQSYLDIALNYSRMAQAMECLLKAPGCALFHCTAGKDRTGVVTALLMALCGVPMLDILADYQLSQAYLRGNTNARLRRHPEVKPEAVTPQIHFMEEFWALFHQRYDHMEDYFSALGFGDKKLAALRAKLVQ